MESVSHNDKLAVLPSECGKESWNGVALAEAAEKDDLPPAAMLREEADGASTSSSASSSSSSGTDLNAFIKSRDAAKPEGGGGGGGGSKPDEEGDFESDSIPWMRDEKLLEELFRLKIAPSSLSGTAASRAGASLPPKQRIKLYQPRTKLEQFEDILLESQLLESSLPDFEVAALAEAAGIAATDLDFDLLEGFDFEASDAIFNEGSSASALAVALEDAAKDVTNTEDDEAEGQQKVDPISSSESSQASSTCDCPSCRERHTIEAKEADEVDRLRQCWLQVREDVWRVYHLVLANAWNDPNRADEKPDLVALQDKVHQLVWRDAHQLFLRLEAGVREFVLEIKLKLIELLQKQAKNPSLARDFLQYLLESYEKLCSAAQHVAPALRDLEVEHLRRFSLTWEVLNKHLYQSMIYNEPLIENNLPIFLSQLRSLYPDKEHEARYTELVRAYLDFDVEMVNIGSFWRNSETMITEYNHQQNLLRAKQRMIKEDWERFKQQRKELEKQIKGKDQTPGSENCECDVCNLPGMPPLTKSGSSQSAVLPVTCSTSSGPARSSSCGDKIPDLSKLYPHLYQTMLQGTSSGSPSSSLRDNTSLSALFPSLLTVDGPKNSATSSSVAAELSQALSTALSLTDKLPAPSGTTATCTTTSTTMPPYTAKSADSRTAAADKATTVGSKCVDIEGKLSSSLAAKKTNAEINKLLQQHYCSHKKKHLTPSANAIRKGKVPPPGATHCPGDGDSTDELSEDSSSLAPEDTCTSASSLTSHGGNGKCSCCYCEVFGNVAGNGAVQTVAPVSRNYHEMRERLQRLLLSKKKKMEQGRCKQQPQPPPAQQQQPQPGAVIKPLSNSASSSSIKSATSNGVVSAAASAAAAARATQAVNHSTVTGNQRSVSSMPPQAVPKQPQVIIKPAPPVNNIANGQAKVIAQARSQSASALATAPKATTPTPVRRIEKSSSAVAPKRPSVDGGKPSEKDLESLIEFIEGNAAANDKKKAKKERQKQQRMEEQRARELEERRIREAEEAERKRREEEERVRQELERQMLKKQKKKAAQRAKKAAAKGVPLRDDGLSSDGDDDDLSQKSQPKSEKMMTLEELRARQNRELEELRARHQRQMEEEQRKLMEALSQQQQQQQKNQPEPSKKSRKKKSKEKEMSAPPSSSGATPHQQNILSAVAKAGPGTQIKITRTPSGGVEFTTIPADEAATTPKMSFFESATSSGPPAPSADNGLPPYLQNMMFGPAASAPQPYFTVSQPTAPPPQSSPAASERPSIPSKSNQPMLTIRRIENPAFSEPTVTISAAADNDKKLLYTLINGQIHRAKDAPSDLIPSAKPLTADISKKLIPTASQPPRVPSSSLSSVSPSAPPKASSQPPTSQQRPPLPVDSSGRLDLNRLQLPPGISITKIQGSPPERKYFPSKPDNDQTVLALPGTLNNKPSPAVNTNGLGYSTVPGLPSSLDGPNVIVVDTMTLKTREEEAREAETRKKRKNRKKKENTEPPSSNIIHATPAPLSPAAAPAGAFPFLAPQIPQDSSNSLKSGPQVLIKNINGSVVITPIPASAPTPAPAAATMNNSGNKKSVNGNVSINNSANNIRSRESPTKSGRNESTTEMKMSTPTASSTTATTTSSSVINTSAKNCRPSIGENIDEINSIFAPKDIDLDAGDIDEDEREIEAFKRFCFDSVPLQQKTKVNFDVKNIAFKKK